MNTPRVLQSIPLQGVIDLGLGNPDNALLPLELLQDAARRFFETGDARALQYGFEQGDGRLREALAAFVTEAYGGIPVDPARLFVTAGASSGLDLVCTLFTRSGDTILVEEPTYFLALRLFEDRGLRPIPVPMDADGLRVDLLEECMRAHQPKLLYIIPTFHNPSGRTLSAQRRERLVELARRHDVVVAADEVYHFLAYGQQPPQPFAAATIEAENVISINSFSKILAPGLRLGWIQAHENVIKKLLGAGLLDSGGGLNPFTSAVVWKLVESGGLAENIAHLKAVYLHRLQSMDDALREYLPGAEWSTPQGGFFCWVRLPGVDTAALRRRAAEHRVDFREGALFSSGGGLQEYLRLCFSYYDEEEIIEGIRRLGASLSDHDSPTIIT